MISADRDAWECDLAETYGILDYTTVPVKKLAMLSAGLRDTSRIKLKMGQVPFGPVETLLSGIIDRLATLSWQIGGTGKQPPASLLDIMSNMEDQDDPNEPQHFDSPIAYEEAWVAATGVRHGI